MTHVGCLSAWAGVIELLDRRIAERAAGSREPDLLHLAGRAAAHRLVDGVVLGVDGQERNVPGAGGRDDQVAGSDEALLIGEANGFAGLDGRVGGLKARNANDRGDDELNLWMGRDCDRARGRALDFDSGNVFGFEAGAEGFSVALGGQRDQLRAPAFGLLKGQIDVGAGGEGDGGVTVGKLLADGEGGGADRAS
jgi:hypothetical protein